MENADIAETKLKLENPNHVLKPLKITGVNSEFRNQLINRWKENDRCEIRTTNS